MGWAHHILPWSASSSVVSLLVLLCASPRTENIPLPWAGGTWGLYKSMNASNNINSRRESASLPLRHIYHDLYKLLECRWERFSTVGLSMPFQKSPAFTGVSVVCEISCWNISSRLRNRDRLISLRLASYFARSHCELCSFATAGICGLEWICLTWAMTGT